MIGKMIGAEVGRRVARGRSPLVGAVIGAAAPWLLRRAFMPVVITAAGAFAIKKLLDKKNERDRAAVRIDKVTRPEATASDSTATQARP